MSKLTEDTRRHIYSDVGLNNAALDIYAAINTWLDGLISAGKLTEREGNLISRGDVARLNGEVLKAIKAHSYTQTEVSK